MWLAEYGPVIGAVLAAIGALLTAGYLLRALALVEEEEEGCDREDGNRSVT